MIYADFPYYQDFYCGTSITDAAAFRTAAARASEYIDSITFGRLRNGIPDAYTEQVKNCCCALSEAWALFLDAKSGCLQAARVQKPPKPLENTASAIAHQQTLQPLFWTATRQACKVINTAFVCSIWDIQGYYTGGATRIVCK